MINGTCLSKKDFFELMKYFDKISDHEPKLGVKCIFNKIEFFIAFADKPHI